MEWMQAIILGLTFGAGTLLFVGPVLFYLIKSTVESGQKAGFMVALGIITGDILYVFIVMNGLSEYLNSTVAQQYLAILGGLILMILGIKNMLSRLQVEWSTLHKNAPNLMQYFVQGFLVNFVNPFVIAVWIGFYMVCETRLSTTLHSSLALITCLVFILATDLCKVIAAVHLKQFLNQKRLQLTAKLFGTIMLLFGIRLLYVGLVV